MIFARCNFGKCPDTLDKDNFEDLVHEYFAALLHNWQVLDHYDLAWQDDELLVYAPISRRDATADYYHSSMGQMALDKLNDLTKFIPAWEILDNQSIEEIDNFEDTKSLVLFTTFLEIKSPLVSLDTKKSVALCALDISEKLRNDIYFWNDRYHNLDSIFMQSEDLEIEAYTQIADVESSLSKNGLKICQEIEHATGIKTYYYLHRYAGKQNEGVEFNRPCPLCHQEWLVTPKDAINPLKQDRLDFSFKCEQCSLVSHHPQCNDDSKLADIGLHLPE